MNEIPTHYIKIDHFNLVNVFCRTNNDHGGSCTYVKKDTMANEVNYLQGLHMSFGNIITDLLVYAIKEIMSNLQDPHSLTTLGLLLLSHHLDSNHILLHYTCHNHH
jgi:hypothetical protein